MKKVNPLEVYTTHMAIKLHFEAGSYNAFHFGFKGPKMKITTFNASKDRFWYEKLANKYPKKDELIDFLLANYLYGNRWIRDYNEDVYLEWLGKIQSLSYRFNVDMERTLDYCINYDKTFDNLLELRNPILIFELLKRGTISEESVIIIDVLTEFIKKINTSLISDPLGIISDMVYRTKQYRPFIINRINKNAARNTVLNLFTSVHK